ncbi:MipA/OmpV family protein [Enterobacillus tribolii]|nr:MipA/OmpV family protein [Enterobacillus tribolii]MBW7983258.1 MipA/OmpV family protein [Enterobacillus tribolii]
MKLSVVGLLMGGMLAAGGAQAGTWSLGASALVGTNMYRGYDTKVYPVPVIDYEGDSFYFHTLNVGYYLWKDAHNKLSIDAFYSPFEFKPGDSDDWRMKQLDKRRGTLMAGFSYSHMQDWGTLRASFAGDVLDNSDGMIGDLSYLYPFDFGNWSFKPGVGVTWSSDNQNDYYYGVSGHESARSTLDRYSPGDSWSPYLELSASYEITKQWNAFVMGRYIRLASEIKDSPMVDKSYTGVFWTGVTYTF